MSESRIKALKEQISNYQRNIRVTRESTARYRANGAPLHYQESGKKNIKSLQNQVRICREEIAELKGKKKSRKSSNKSIFSGNILFLPFRIIWWFFKFALKD